MLGVADMTALAGFVARARASGVLYLVHRHLGDVEVMTLAEYERFADAHKYWACDTWLKAEARRLTIGRN